MVATRGLLRCGAKATIALGGYHEAEVVCGRPANHEAIYHSAVSTNRVGPVRVGGAKDLQWRDDPAVLTWEWPVTGEERQRMDKARAEEAQRAVQQGQPA